MESAAVGSIVTIAVITAKTGGQCSSWQSKAVTKIATPVFTTRLPANRNRFKLSPPNESGLFFDPNYTMNTNLVWLLSKKWSVL
jgi:hypothetical protein